MPKLDTYSVICTGEITDGQELDLVQQTICDLFQLSPEKARTFLSARRILKIVLPQAMAFDYKSKLESIGVVALLEKVEADSLSEFDSLALVRKEESLTGEKPLEKDRTDEICKQTFQNSQELQEEKPDRFDLAAVSAATGAAFLGALAWNLIAVVFHYELSFVAWGIGGLIGYAALAMESRGLLCGIVCGVLVLLSVMGGKYLAVSSMQEQAHNAFANVSQVENFSGSLDPVVKGGANSISTWELFKERFGVLDLIFLFLGIGTAFKLGSSGFKQNKIIKAGTDS